MVLTQSFAVLLDVNWLVAALTAGQCAVDAQDSADQNTNREAGGEHCGNRAADSDCIDDHADTGRDDGTEGTSGSDQRSGVCFITEL